MFKVFNITDLEYSKNTSAFCIGMLYKAREISNQRMKIDVISHLKTLVIDNDEENYD